MNKILKIKEYLYKILGKDCQLIRQQRYRSLGAKIGENCRIFTDLSFSEPYLVSIGDNVTISTGVTILTHDNSPIKYMNNYTDVVGMVYIGNHCFIGANTIIMPGITLADGTIVGAGSVVVKSTRKDNTVIAGNPAKEICSTNDLSDKYTNYAFNLKGLSKDERKNTILAKNDRYISR